MFTGIIETMATLVAKDNEGSNIHFWFSSDILKELKIDQSVAHNGVCLTVVDILTDRYKVTAIAETLNRTNLGGIEIGNLVNLERCMPSNGRFDGHIVQGHVDDVATCQTVEDMNGSWSYVFKLADDKQQKLIVQKGSICINGVSLTVVDCEQDWFSVAIIPYTHEHTNFIFIQRNSKVNIEFDIVGKYILKHLEK
ncbi:MAG: riboflavin synthase [Bacteroidetes bacterium]|nr:riboflavin synthase [Bacteroidota bacterium]